jgi:hypothetical protein
MSQKITMIFCGFASDVGSGRDFAIATAADLVVGACCTGNGIAGMLLSENRQCLSFLLFFFVFFLNFIVAKY